MEAERSEQAWREQVNGEDGVNDYLDFLERGIPSASYGGFDVCQARVDRAVAAKHGVVR